MISKLQMQFSQGYAKLCATKQITERKFVQPYEVVTQLTQCYPGCNTQFYFKVYPYSNDGSQYSMHESWYQKSKLQKLGKTMCDKTTRHFTQFT